MVRLTRASRFRKPYLVEPEFIVFRNRFRNPWSRLIEIALNVEQSPKDTKKVSSSVACACVVAKEHKIVQSSPSAEKHRDIYAAIFVTRLKIDRIRFVK